MLLADFFGWWYSRGWTWVLQQFFFVYVMRTLQFFSVSELFRTLFAPFRQDVIETKNAPIGVKLQVMGQNIISRFFGFIIRTILILVGLFCLIGCLLAGAIAAIIWPILPAGPVVIPVIVSMVV